MIFEHTFEREFDGNVASVSITIDTDKGPEASNEFMLRYGLKQKFSDSYASAKDAAEFEGKLRKAVDAYWAGTLSERTVVRSPKDERKRLMLEIARERYFAILKLKGKKPSIYSKETLAKAVGDYLERNTDDIGAEADRRMEAAKAIADDFDLPEPDAESAEDLDEAA